MAEIVHGTAPLRSDDEITVLGAILKRTSWGAVVAGAVVAVSVQMILTVLGIALGITTNDVMAGPGRVQEGMGTAVAVWWLVTGTLSLFAGGCIVGRMAGMTRNPDVLLHAFTMWAVTALFGFLVVTAGAGALYGTSLDATYSGAQTYMDGQRALNGQTLTGDETTTLRDENGNVAVVTRDEAQRYVRTASWWTLFGLALGIAAALGGSWLTAPARIAVRPATQGSDTLRTPAGYSS